MCDNIVFCIYALSKERSEFLSQLLFVLLKSWHILFQLALKYRQVKWWWNMH